jgi:tetratricopeptide (TPR) repeat protein
MATEKDPTSAKAWTALAGAYAADARFGGDPQMKIALPKALDAVQRAIQLDPLDGMAHAVFADLLATQGQIKRSEAEYDTALRLNPGSADIMAMYVGMASGFGHPQRGAELTDQAIRLNPRYPSGEAGPFSYAYMMAGRFEDAVRVLEQQSTENFHIYPWVIGSASYAMLGRVDEAKVWVAKTLEKYPNLTIEGFLSTPDWNDRERKFLSDAMRRAGFPVCAARREDIATSAMAALLPECERK